MTIYTATFPGHWVGGDAIVSASDRPTAITALIDAAKEHGLTLTEEDITLEPFTPRKGSPTVRILSDGQY